MSRRALLAFVGTVVLAGSLGCSTRNDQPDPNVVRLDIDRRQPEKLLRFYFGGFLGPEGGDPFSNGVLTKRSNNFFLDIRNLQGLARDTVAPPPKETVQNWDSLETYLRDTYYELRRIPTTLDDAAERYGLEHGDWFVLEVDGVMTNARRRLLMPRQALRYAMANYRVNGGHLIYPAGTTILGEHREPVGNDTLVVETTLMAKRQDGFWDFAVYDSSGRLASTTQTEPKALKVPTQCVGCHFGSRRFEPEKSFPGRAPAGPYGPRRIHVTEHDRNAEITARLDEHGKRSDTILGLYATIAASRWVSDARAERLSEDDAALLDTLKIKY